MELVDYFRHQFAYDDWANREVLTALRTHRADERPLELLAHILGAKRIWLERLKQQPQRIPVWPRLSLEECETHVAELSRAWREYLDSVSPGQLAQPISYTNSKGERWSSTVQDVLTHVILHSAYHRGQIASTMRAKSQTPAYTDFIHAARQELIE